MKVNTQGNTTVFKHTQEDINYFLEQVNEQYHSYNTTNFILDLSELKQATNQDVILFADLSATHTQNKKSFVLVMSDGFDFNEAPEEIIVVPSLQEAHDIIEMEEIERDLGF